MRTLQAALSSSRKLDNLAVIPTAGISTLNESFSRSSRSRLVGLLVTDNSTTGLLTAGLKQVAEASQGRSLRLSG